MGRAEVENFLLGLQGAYVHCRSATPYHSDIFKDGVSLGDTSRFQYFSLKQSGTVEAFVFFWRGNTVRLI